MGEERAAESSSAGATRKLASVLRSIVERRETIVSRFSSASGDELLAGLFAIAGLFLLLATSLLWPSVVLGVASLVVIGISSTNIMGQAWEVGQQIAPTGAFVASRLVLVGLAAGLHGVLGPWLWGAAAVLAALIALEASCVAIAKSAVPYAERVPGISVKNAGVFTASYLFFVNLVALILVAILSLAAASAWGQWIVVLAACVPNAAFALDGVARIRDRQRAERTLTRKLTEYAPTFAVYWEAPRGTEYQLAMWLPYLQQLGERFIVVLRNEATFASIAAMTQQPVLLRKELADMDAVVVPSLKAAFYVNNAMVNSHFVRYPHLKHIQLNHGDSDKAPSYNPVFRMFDKDFVAGQAAIDRFAVHGVDVSGDLFAIVGRPQIADVEIGAPAIAPHTVLYAPTWAGYNADSAYSSLSIGPEIVSALIRRGCTVIYRPHPYTSRTKSFHATSVRIKELLGKDAAASNRQHVWGDTAERSMSLVDCFNAADALVSDVSSVVPDFLYSQKPYAVTAMRGTVESFTEEFPLARGGYTITADAANLEEALDNLLGADPLRGLRDELKTYYLGDIPPEQYVDAFLDAARDVIR